MSDISFFQLQSIPPSHQAIVTGANLSGTPNLSTTQNHSSGILDAIWAAVPFGPLISKVPSISTAAKGVAIGAAEAGKGIGTAVTTTAKAAVGGIEKGLILVVVLVAGYLLLPVFLASRRP